MIFRTPVLRNVPSANTFRKTVYCITLLEMHNDHQHSKGSEKSCCVLTYLVLFNPVFPWSNHQFFPEMSLSPTGEMLPMWRFWKLLLPTCLYCDCWEGKERVRDTICTAEGSCSSGAAKQNGCISEWALYGAGTKRRKGGVTFKAKHWPDFMIQPLSMTCVTILLGSHSSGHTSDF